MDWFVRIIYLTIVSVGGVALAQPAPTGEWSLERASQPAPAGDWSLERALQTAQAHSPTLERIDATVRAASLSRLEALSRLGPAVQASASYVRNEEEVALTLPSSSGQAQENVLTPLEQESARLTVTLPVFDPQRWAAARRAGHLAAAAAAEGRDARSQFRLAVAGAYLDAVVADGRLEVAERTLEVDRLRLEGSRARAELGRERRSAVLRLEAELLASEQIRDEARWHARSARDVLAIYVGSPIDGPLAPVSLPAPSTAAHAPGTAAQAPDTAPQAPGSEALAMNAGTATAALLANPTLEAARARVAASSASRRQAWAAFLPRLDTSFSYSWTDPASFNNPDGEAWSFLVTGSWTLFDSGGRLAASRRARAELRASQAAYEEMLEALRREESRLEVETRASSQAIAVAEARVQAAELAAAETRADYDEGAVLLADLQAADAALAQARAALVEARARAARAALSLEHLYGRL